MFATSADAVMSVREFVARTGVRVEESVPARGDLSLAFCAAVGQRVQGLDWPQAQVVEVGTF